MRTASRATFRGVVVSGVFDSPESFALAVSHPHPDNDHGGGPGPVEQWRLPYDLEAFRSLIDFDDDSDSDDDVQYEVREVQHVALCDHGAFSIIELPATGVIVSLRAIDADTLAALVTYGGSAYYVWHYARQGGATRSFDILGLPQGVHGVRGAIVGDVLVLVGRLGDQSVAGVATRAPVEGGAEEALVWSRSLGTIPEPVLAFDACRGENGALVVYAAGTRLWQLSGDSWVDVQGSSTTFEHVTCAPSGEVVAGTSKGDVYIGIGTRCRHAARVGVIHSAVRFRDAVFVADADRVYRIRDDSSGFEKCFVPPTRSIGDWPTAGALSVGGGRLWLAGSHSIASTEDGAHWTLLEVGT